MFQVSDVEPQPDQCQGDHNQGKPEPDTPELPFLQRLLASSIRLSRHRKSGIGVPLQFGVAEAMNRDARLQQRIARLCLLQLGLADFHALPFGSAE